MAVAKLSIVEKVSRGSVGHRRRPRPVCRLANVPPPATLRGHDVDRNAPLPRARDHVPGVGIGHAGDDHGVGGRDQFRVPPVEGVAPVAGGPPMTRTRKDMRGVWAHLIPARDVG